MSIMLFNDLLNMPFLCPNYRFIILLFIFSLSGFAQNNPYLQLPENTNSINTLNPTFSWKGGENFVSYQLKLYNCEYEKGRNFEELGLENYRFVLAVEGEMGYESSNLTINESRPGSLVTVDDGGIKMTSFKNNFTSPSEVPIFDLEGNNYEGLTYLYNDYFVMVEEYRDQLLFLNLKYSSSNSLTAVEHLRTYDFNNSFITGANDGWEGITYDPINNKLYLIKETNSPSIYEGVCTKAPYFSGSIQLEEPFILTSTTWKPDDVSALYHLSLNKALSATPTGEHLLILSKATKSIYEFDLSGKLISQLRINTSELEQYNDGFFKPEGLAYSDGKLYISSDSDIFRSAMYYVYENREHQNAMAEDKELIFQSPQISNTQFNLPAGILKNDAEYCWQVTAFDSNGKAYESSDFSFEVALRCYNYLTHLQNSFIDEKQFYANFVRSYKTVEKEDTLEYYVDEFIYLEKGFEVKKGGSFIAEIGECE